MPDEPSFNQQMVTKLQALLLKNVGVQSVTVDGVAVSYADLQRELDHYEARLARENGTKPRIARINLGGF